MSERFEIEDSEGVELVPVPMDRETRRRLVLFSRAIGKQPIHAASVLLTDLLADEEFFNAAARAAAN